MAEMWQQVMREEGIPAMLAPQDTSSFLGLTYAPVRLMVPVEMEARVLEVLDRLRSGSAPFSEDDLSR